MDENNLNTQDGQGPNLVPDGGDNNKLPLRRKVAIGAAVALVVAGLGLGGAWAIGAFAPKSEVTKIEVDSDGGKKQVSEKTEPTVDWAVKIEAGGVTADSSPLITRYVCTDGADKGVEFYHATSASDAIEGKGGVQLTEGTWEITAIPIMNPDGSITTPVGGGEQVVSGDKKHSGNTEFTGDTKPAGDVTQDDIDKVLDKVNEAVSKGDGTLTGDAGKDVVNKVTDNASKAPAADKRIPAICHTKSPRRNGVGFRDRWGGTARLCRLPHTPVQALPAYLILRTRMTPSMAPILASASSSGSPCTSRMV